MLKMSLGLFLKCFCRTGLALVFLILFLSAIGCSEDNHNYHSPYGDGHYRRPRYDDYYHGGRHRDDYYRKRDDYYHDRLERERYRNQQFNRELNRSTNYGRRAACPAGWNLSDRKCSDSERRHGCQDQHPSSGAGACVRGR